MLRRAVPAIFALVIAGACESQDDTVVTVATAVASSSSSSTGGGGAGTGGEGGQGGTPDPMSAEAFFEMHVKEPFNDACAGGGCHSGGMLAFIPAGQEYLTLRHYKTRALAKGTPLVKADFQTSFLLTYPNSIDHTGNEQPTVAAYDDPGGVRELVFTWLEMEAAEIVESPPLEVGPFELIPGFNALSLEGLGPDFAGHNLSVTATAFGDPVSVMELTEIQAVPLPQRGLLLDDPTIIMVPPDGGEPVTYDALHGEGILFAPPNVTIGPGSVLITDWVEGAQLSVRFAGAKVLYADGAGDTYVACYTLQPFIDAVESLDANGLDGCASACHGGSDASATGAFDLSGLAASPIDWGHACAVTRSQIATGSPASSAIFTHVNPDGTGATEGHDEFVFANATAFDAFEAAMTAWIQEE